MRPFLRLSAFGTVFLLAGIARATPARIVGLGDMGEYIEDDTNVLLYPGLIAKYAHFAYIDLGGGQNGIQTGPFSTLSEIQVGGGPNGAALVRLGDFQLGVFTSDYTSSEESIFLSNVAAHSSSTFAGNSAAFTALANNNNMRRYDLLLGYGSAKDFAAGLRFSYSGWDQGYTAPEGDILTDPVTGGKTTRTSDSQSLTQLRLAAGLSFNFGGGTLLDTTLDYTYFGASYLKNGTPTFNGGSGNAIGIAARLRVPISRFWTLIPQVSYRGWFFGLEEKFSLPAFGSGDNTASDPLDKGQETLEHSMNQHYFDFGIAGELKAAKFATFWLAGGFAVAGFGTNDTDVDLNTKLNIGTTNAGILRSLPYVKFAAELAPFEFWKVRLGAEKYVWELTESQTTSNSANPMEMPALPVSRTSSFSGSSQPVPAGNTDPLRAYLAQSDFNVYTGMSFIIPYGFGVDLLLFNQVLTGNFLKGWAGRASVSYKF
jgi:hypothetical protein